MSGVRAYSYLFSILSVIAAIISIQTGAAAAKFLFPAVGAQGATALRLCLAALILCLLFQPWRERLTRKGVIALFSYGVALAGMNLLIYLALERIPLGLAVAIEFTGPLAVALFASRRALDFLWAALAVAGIALLLPLDSSQQVLDPIGISYALAAGVCWALYILCGRKAGNGIASGRATALGMTLAALIALPFGVAHAGGALLDASLLPLALSIAVLSSALPYTIEMAALKKIPAQTFGILMSLEPALAAISGLLILGEHLAVIQWLAIVCVMAASLGSAIFSKPAAITPEANV